MINVAQIPSTILESERAVVWRWETRNGKPDKPPYIATHPSRHAKANDPSTWRSFRTAVDTVLDGKADGPGYVLGDGVAGIDLDDCRDLQTGDIAAWAQAIIDDFASYTEISPSGTGVKIWLEIDKTLTLEGINHKRPDGSAIEMYVVGKYFTVTGQHLQGTPLTVEARTSQFVALHTRLLSAKSNGNGHSRRNGASLDFRSGTKIQSSGPTHIGAPAHQFLDDQALLDRARQASNGAKFSSLWNGDISDYPSASEADLAICNLLAFWTGGDGARIDSLYRQSGLMREKWDERHGQTTYGERTIEMAIAGCRETYAGATHARVNGEQHQTWSTVAGSAHEPCATDTPLVFDPGDPLPTARTFVKQAYTADGVLALRHQAGVFYAHHGSAYAERDEAAIRADLYRFLEPAHAWSKPIGDQQPKLGPFKPTKSKVENVLDALRAVSNLPASQAPPCWLEDDPGLDPFEMVPCRNGLLHIPTRELFAATPRFFTLNGLDFSYDSRAAAPNVWLRFLDELWQDDPESRETLQEFIGYLLTPRTHFQKIAMVVGPKRSGKGTIGRVTRRLLGDRNVCGPTLANMGEQFGLSILIGKSAAIIADARISGRTDTAVITERLLSISGEDTLSIPRKYLPDWNGKLSTRFLLMTNELPRIEDASGALSSRFVVLTLNQSFYGREDHGLFDRFLPELPGILNWALEGWDRLYARGRFVQPQSSSALIQEFEDLGSPIGAFIRDRCDVGPGYEVMQQRVFEAWKTWCQETGRDRAGTIQTFGRNLRAALPWLTTTQPRVLGQRVRYWSGLQIREGG